MITAEEARIKVSDLTIGKNKKQIDICEAKINEAVDIGAISVSIEISLTIPVKCYLESLGYEVEGSSHMNEYCTTISW